jgi:hypothetical protein
MISSFRENVTISSCQRYVSCLACNSSGIKDFIRSVYYDETGVLLANNTCTSCGTLNPDDTLFLYTDGLVENVGIDGKALKRSKMNSILSSSKDRKEVVANLSAEVIQLWKGVEAEDDVSMMALTWHHRAA